MRQIPLREDLGPSQHIDQITHLPGIVSQMGIVIEQLRSHRQYAIEQFTRMEEAMQDGVNIILDAVREASTTLDQAKRHVGQ